MSKPSLKLSAIVCEIGAGARGFEWRRFFYLLAMAGAAGAALVLLVLASSTAYAAEPPSLDWIAPAAAEPTEMFEEMREHFLMWSMVLGSVVLLGLALPFVLSGLLLVVGRVALLLVVAMLAIAGAALVAVTWVATYATAGALGATRRPVPPLLQRLATEVRQAVQLLSGRGIVR